MKRVIIVFIFASLLACSSDDSVKDKEVAVDNISLIHGSWYLYDITDADGKPLLVACEKEGCKLIVDSNEEKFDWFTRVTYIYSDGATCHDNIRELNDFIDLKVTSTSNLEAKRVTSSGSYATYRFGVKLTTGNESKLEFYIYELETTHGTSIVTRDRQIIYHYRRN